MTTFYEQSKAINFVVALEKKKVIEETQGPLVI